MVKKISGALCGQSYKNNKIIQKQLSHMGCFFCQKDKYIDGIDCHKIMYVSNIQQNNNLNIFYIQKIFLILKTPFFNKDYSFLK